MTSTLPEREIQSRVLRRGRERDLAHDADPERFGSAMLRCEGYAPGCSEAGHCLNGGLCFKGPPHVTAARMIEHLLKQHDRGQGGMHLAYLRMCAKMLREGSVSI